MEVKSRYHLRSDAIEAISETLSGELGVELDGDRFENVETVDGVDVVLVDGDPLVAMFDDEPFLTVRGANAYPPSRQTVTVDAGAIEFVSNGANIMRPGIVAADAAIETDELVVVQEETHRKALAVGRALVGGDEMRGDAGQVVESRHHVGDALFEFSV
jgi:arCOG04150 universal archaeal PUA-domain protein